MAELLDGLRRDEGIDLGEGGADPLDQCVATDPAEIAAHNKAREGVRQLITWFNTGRFDEAQFRAAIATADDGKQAQMQRDLVEQ